MCVLDKKTKDDGMNRISILSRDEGAKKIRRTTMKLFSVSILVGICLGLFLADLGAGFRQEENDESTALLLIDIQDFYFPGGRSALENPEEASLNAQKLLNHFRGQNHPVVHVRHNSKTGAEIHKNVAPLGSEKVITKNSINAFKDTDLLEFLKQNGIEKLVVCGMMTHMCVEAAVRAGADFSFEVTLIQDACATRALKYGETEIPADTVHASTLASLSGYYAVVTDTAAFLSNFIQ